MTLPNHGLVAFLSEEDVVVNIILMENPTEIKINQVLEVSPAYFRGVDLSDYPYPVKFGAVWNGTVYINPAPNNEYTIAGQTFSDNDWVLDETTGQWNRPVPYPSDDNTYVWNVTDHNWEVVPE
jgi:hypothetical protein